VRFDNNWVGCNDPCEDRHVENYLSREILSAKPLKATDKNNLILPDRPETSTLKLFSMIDGHGGGATADVLARELHLSVIKSLQSLCNGQKPNTVDPMLSMRLLQRSDYRTFLQKFFTMEGGQKNLISKLAPSVPFKSDFISNALASAYMALDYDICTKPLRLIANGKSDTKTEADVKAISEPATSGACALTVLVDEDRQEVYVANTGDCRAVAGYYVPPQTDSYGIHYQGGWRCEVLTDDHLAIGPKETQRWVCDSSLLSALESVIWERLNRLLKQIEK
jgi:pyruvate dehydrogenase phosphatase